MRYISTLLNRISGKTSTPALSTSGCYPVDDALPDSKVQILKEILWKSSQEQTQRYWSWSKFWITLAREQTNSLRIQSNRDQSDSSTSKAFWKGLKKWLS